MTLTLCFLQCRKVNKAHTRQDTPLLVHCRLALTWYIPQRGGNKEKYKLGSVEIIIEVGGVPTLGSSSML